MVVVFFVCVIIYVLSMTIKDIQPYPQNAKKHDKKQITQIANSIKAFGMNQPIVVDKKGIIIVGHGRYYACLEANIEPEIRVVDLNEEQANAYRFADNKLNESDWDMKLALPDLKILSPEMFALTGFDKDLLIEPDSRDDVIPENVPARSKLGDLYELGQHRLLCGDSTQPEAVSRLMDGKKADMVFTDPPYNVAFNGRSGKFEVIMNDELSDGDFAKFIEAFLYMVEEVIKANTYYICCNWAFYGIMQTRLKPKACIVWAKNVFGLGKGYRHQHEFILFDGLIDPEIKNESDLWQMKKDTNYKHPTQKPVELSERAIINSTKRDNIVIDLFLGSGSTLVACEKTGRICYAQELDPKYVDYVDNPVVKCNGKDVTKLWKKTQKALSKAV